MRETKNQKFQNIYIALAGVIIIIVSLVFYQKKVRHNLVTITDNKVYNSGAVPPDQLKDFLEAHHIKTVIDLRDGSIQTALNPESQNEVHQEKLAAEEISTVRYYNIPTDQLPSDTAVKKFLAIMDEADSYPVLIHCHHGIGRSRLFSSIYRIEYENFSQEEARKKARLLWEFAGNFSVSSEKGKFLLNYKKR